MRFTTSSSHFGRGRIWMCRSSTLPHTGGSMGSVDGITFHDRTQRTLGMTGVPQKFRFGSTGIVTT